MVAPIKVGVIGVGVGRGHIRDYIQCDDAELVAICDADPARLAEAVEHFQLTSAKTYTDYQEMLKHQGLQAVSIALPNFLHAPVTLAALQAEKHVLCEKPLALNAQEAATMIQAARERGLTLMVNFNYRFSEPSWLIHQAVTSGIVGDIYYAKTGWLRNRGIPGIGGWFTTKRLSGGGALIDLGVHRLDLALWYMGYPQPISATGTIHGQFGKILADSQGKTFDVDDLAVGFVRFANGASLVIEASWAGNSEKREEMFTQIFGTRGGAIQRNVGEGYEFEARIFQDVAGTLTEVKPLSSPQGLEPIRHHFIHCLQKGIEPIAPGEHGLVLMQILDAIYASAASGHAEPINSLL